MILHGQHTALELFQTIAERLNNKLKTQIKTFFLPLILGALFALARRRTVTTWLRAAGLSEDYRRIFYHLRKAVNGYWNIYSTLPSETDSLMGNNFSNSEFECVPSDKIKLTLTCDCMISSTFSSLILEIYQSRQPISRMYG